MSPSHSPSRARIAKLGLTVLAVGLVALTVACSGKSSPPQAAQVPSEATSAAVAAPQTPAAQATDVPKVALKLFKTQPEKGNVGEQFTISGQGLAPNKEIEFVWMTVDGSFETKVTPAIVEFYQAKFDERQVTLGRATTDAQGQVHASFVVPEDFGDTHDIYGVIDGQQVAKGGYRILRQVSIEPSEGPIGTPIKVTVKGLAWTEAISKMALRYDNRLNGFVSAITTHGTAIAEIRAAGPVGMHTIELSGAGNNGGGYLNNQQSPMAYIFPASGSFRVTFSVTADGGAPDNVLQWPDPSRVAKITDSDPIPTVEYAAKAPGSALTLGAASGSKLTLDRTAGPVSTAVKAQAANLPPNTEYDLIWKTVLGHLVNKPGWDREPSRVLGEIPLGKVTSDKDGVVNANFEIPDELGSWHAIQLVKDGAPVSEGRFFVQRSLVSVSAKRVKVGETVTIEIKGAAWSDIDNGVAVTYDNAYIGYACGFNSRGTIVLNLPATGTPGTHLIDLYPMTYIRTGKPGWPYMMPQLTYSRDHPGLGVGYSIPAIRLAIEVVE